MPNKKAKVLVQTTGWLEAWVEVDVPDNFDEDDSFDLHDAAVDKAKEAEYLDWNWVDFNRDDIRVPEHGNVVHYIPELGNWSQPYNDIEVKGILSKCILCNEFVHSWEKLQEQIDPVSRKYRYKHDNCSHP